MLKFASACRRCLSKAANIVRRLYGSYSLPLDLHTSAKNHSRVPFSSCLGISSSLWGSFRHVLHASKWFTHVFVDFVVFLFKFFSLNFCKSSGVAASKMGRVLLRCAGSFSTSGVGKTRNETKRNETAKRPETGSHTQSIDSDCTWLQRSLHPESSFKFERP